MALRLKYVALTFGLFVISQGLQAEIMPDFSTVPVGWTVDRFDPHSFANIGFFQGRSNVLGIEINSAEGFTSRPAPFQSTFYNTQGRAHVITGGPGSVLGADLWIPASWSTNVNGSIRTDMWGTVVDNTNSVVDFPIISFTNDFGGPARFRVWDVIPGVWIDVAAPVHFNAWNRFETTFTGTTFIYSINGVPVQTVAADPSDVAFSSTIMQAYNFFGDPSLVGANPVNYIARWANTTTNPFFPFDPPTSAYQLNYLSAQVGGGIAGGYVDISNDGSLGADAFGPLSGTTGRICANVYVFTADEQESECCSCLVTPNALVRLTAADLIGNPGNGVTPTLGIVVKLLATIPGASASAPGTVAGPFTGSNCNAATTFTAANLAPGMVAWATKFHTNSTTSPATVGLTETRFSPEPLSAGELTKLTNLCQFLAGNQSGAGLCKACSLGGLGAGRR